MKLSLVTISIVTVLGLLTFACDDDPNALGGENDGRFNQENEETAPLPNEKKSGTTTPPAASSSASSTTNTTTPPKPATPKPNCSAEATGLKCTQCCATNNGGGTNTNADANPLKACACGAAGKCATECADSVCTDKFPSIGCGICIAGAGCNMNGAGGGAGAGGGNTAAVQQCIESSGCGAKPKS